MTSLVLEKLEEADPEVLTPCDILRWAGIWTQKNGWLMPVDLHLEKVTLGKIEK